MAECCDVSVIVPSYNSDKTIQRTLDSLLGQRGNHVVEIIVVDSSDNAGMDVIRRRYAASGVSFVNAGTRVMPAVGRNIGAAMGRGRVLAFIDADAYAADDWVEKIMAAHGRGIVAGGGSVEIPEFQRRHAIAMAQYYLQFNEYICCGTERIKPFVPAVNMYCDREIFHGSGGFPEIRAAEDTLFGFRLGRLARLRFVPEIRVFHVFREDRESYRNNQELLGRYNIIFRRLQYGGLKYRGVVPILLLPAFLSIKMARMAFRIVRAGRTHVAGWLRVLPEFMRGITYWANGFVRGCLEGDAAFLQASALRAKGEDPAQDGSASS